MNKQVGSFWKDLAKLNYYRIDEIVEGGYFITAYDEELKTAYGSYVHAESLQSDIKMTTNERLLFEQKLQEWGYL